MQSITWIKITGYIFSFLTLVGGYVIMYRESGEFFSSLGAALLGFMMVLGTFTVIRWLAQVILK